MKSSTDCFVFAPLHPGYTRKVCPQFKGVPFVCYKWCSRLFDPYAFEPTQGLCVSVWYFGILRNIWPLDSVFVLLPLSASSESRVDSGPHFDKSYSRLVQLGPSWTGREKINICNWFIRARIQPSSPLHRVEGGLRRITGCYQLAENERKVPIVCVTWPGVRMGNRVGRVCGLLLLQTNLRDPGSAGGMAQELKDELCDVYVTLMNCLVLLENFFKPDKRSKWGRCVIESLSPGVKRRKNVPPFELLGKKFCSLRLSIVFNSLFFKRFKSVAHSLNFNTSIQHRILIDLIN